MIRQRQEVVWFAGILLSALCFLGLLLWLGREPRDQGRTLSQWLEVLDNPSAVTNSQAVRAFRRMGARAAVRLVPLLEASDSPLKLQLVGLARKQPFVQISFTPAAAKQQRAARAFEMMEGQAIAAAPQLVSLLVRRGVEPPDYLDDPASRAANALACLGYRVIPYLRPTLYSENARVRQAGVNALAISCYDSAPETTGEMFKLLEDSNPKVREAGAYALGKVRREPELAIPRLVWMLGDVSPSTRKQAAFALGRFGPLASNTVAPLRKTCTDAAPEVRHAAERAIAEIGDGAVTSKDGSKPVLGDEK